MARRYLLGETVQNLLGETVQPSRPHFWCCFAPHFVMSIVALIVGGLFITPAAAGLVQFDATPLVTCLRVDDPVFERQAMDERLIEARCQVSVLALGVPEASLQECLFHFYSPELHTRVYDYLPKTTLVSDVVGNLRVSQNDERSRGLQVSAGAEAASHAQAEISGSANRRHAYSLSYEQLPPLETLSAVGTLGRGAGAYFKQRRTTQSSLEGSREFVLHLQVPKAWRGGYLRLVCQARAVPRHADHEGPLLGSATFLVPLYLAGDTEAKNGARGLWQMEQALIAAAERGSDPLRKASRPTLLHELALTEPKFPDNWLSLILRSPAEADEFGFERALPAGVREALGKYRAVKRRFNQLATSPSEGTSHLPEESESVGPEDTAPDVIANHQVRSEQP